MEIRNIERDGVIKTAIRIGEDDTTIPKHLLQGIKMEGMIISGNQIRPWYWDGMCSIDGSRWVYFPECRLESIEMLSSRRRGDALKIVCSLAYGLMNADNAFLDLASGVFPLYRIFIVDGCDVLLLPPDLGDVFSIMESDEDKKAHTIAMIRGNAEQNFMLITEMAELLYYAASGIYPFADDDIRLSGYKAYPISKAVPDMDPETAGFISFILGAKSREMRDIMGNYEGGKNLSWFLERAEKLEWGLCGKSEEEAKEDAEKLLASSDYASFLEAAGKRAARRSFWRIKGTLIIVIALIAIIGGGFAGNYIYSITRPPLTADMSQEEIIRDFYQAQNELDMTRLTTAVKGDDVPQEMEVANLFVTSRARSAYEMVSPVINAEGWIAEGKPAIAETFVIYGVVLDSVEEVGENEWVAHGTWYVPFPYDEAEEEAEAYGSLVYVYSIDQSFSFIWNSRGWWNISSTEIIGYQHLRTERVETYPLQGSGIGINE